MVLSAPIKESTEVSPMEPYTNQKSEIKTNIEIPDTPKYHSEPFIRIKIDTKTAPGLPQS